MFDNTVKIETIATIKGGKRLPKGHNFSDSITDHPYIRAQDIDNRKIVCIDQKYITNETYSIISRYIVNTNDVCITIVGANVGEVGIVPEELNGANLTENAVKITNLRNYSPHFLFYYLTLTSSQKNMKEVAAGAAQPKLGLYKIKDIEVPNVELRIQEYIVDIIRKYDDLIENNNARIKILEELAQRLYTEWFVKFKFPGHEKVKMVDSGSEFGMIPEGWDIKKLGDSVNIRKGKNITRKTIINGTIPVVAGGKYPAYYHNRSNAKAPVITVSASGANAGYINIWLEDIWASDCSYIDITSTNTPVYFYLALMNLKKQISNLRRGAAQPHVYPKDLISLSYLEPDVKVISDFSEIVEKQYREIGIMQKSIRISMEMRKLLIDNLITGSLILKT